jgi:dTDP-4-dehydrorhamnose reductase
MEQRVLDIAPDAVMLRAEWMYDYYLKKSNYFMNILRAEEPLCFSSRQFRGVTYVKEVAENMENVMRLPGGAYNFGSETTRSMYDITKEFLAALGKSVRVEDAPPRHNLWMNCEKARRLGVDFLSVEEGLKACAKDYGVLVNS